MLTTPISITRLTRPLLLKVNSRKWRRMAKGRCHSLDNPLEATLGLASHSLTSFSSHCRWTEHRYRCKCSAPNFRWNGHSARCRDQMLRCSEHCSRWTDKVCNSSYGRTRNQYLAWQCPNKLSAPGAGGQSRPQGQQNYTCGKINHVTTEEAQHAQDIVLGMFLTSSHPATILFDSGASHSFISSSSVVKHHLPITIMKQTMLVSSPGGEMRTKHICPKISITMRGYTF
jgi:hypothetical protein